MNVPGMRWFAEKLLDRMRALLWGMVASDVETESVLHQAENLSRIEDYARQLESEGKLQQAEALRQRAAGLNSASPAGLALNAIADVAGDNHARLEGPEQASGGTGQNKSRAALPSPSRSRSRARRPSRRKQPASNKSNEPAAPDNRNESETEK